MYTVRYTHSFAFLEKRVEMESPERGKFQCKGILLSCSCDLPAQCFLCNSMQYNGENGCWKSLQPGQIVRRGVRGHSRAFLYQNDNPKGLLRTSQGVREDAIGAATLQQQDGFFLFYFIYLVCPKSTSFTIFHSSLKQQH